MSMPKKLMIALVIFAGGFFAGYFAQRYLFAPKAPLGYAVREGGYKFISPLLFCNISENKEFNELIPLKNKIKELADTEARAGHASNISVYFRDLNKGKWTGINENDRFAPASLLKVPLLIAYLKQAEAHPEILSEQLAYKGDFDDNRAESIKPLKSIESGKSYSVDDLLIYMILYSDNNALRLLNDNINAGARDEVYTDLGLSLPANDASVDFMSAKSYSYFFRILYNASYLSKDFSEKALKLLSAPDFPQGIKGGIPPNVSAAQKFGERTVLDTQGNVLNRELHDCGIVYYPDDPYLLCVMTRGNSFDNLSNVIKNISSLIYKEVDGGILR